MKKFYGLTYRVYKNTVSQLFLFLFGPGCRHTPSCSEYAKDAFLKYGPIKGGFVSLKRVLRCNPLFKGGYDPA